jgi:hypothetical protein
MRLLATLAAFCGFTLLPLMADFSYQQTSRITGGSMMRMMKMVPGGGKALEPQVSSQLFRGGQMASVSSTAIDVIDVDRQVMTHIDLEKKTYATITFAEFRQALDAISKKMQQQMGQQQNQASMDFRVDVKDGGQSKVIEGMSTNLMKMLLAMDVKDQKSGQATTVNMDMDMWMTKDVPGYDEVKKFHQKYAEAVGMTPEMVRMSRMAMGQPGLGEGMAKMMKEASKLQGVPLLQVTRMTGIGGPGGEMPEVKMPSGKEVGDAAATSAVSSALGRIGGIGGLGGFGRKKKEAPKEEPKPAEQPKPAPSGPPQPSVFMEMTSEMSGFSTAAVDGSKFSAPAGFKEVEHDMKKAIREMK